MTTLFAAALLGCGGSEGPTPSGAEVETAMADGGVVIGAEDSGVRTEGAFERASGYLSKSTTVLRSKRPDAAVEVESAVAQRGFYELFTWWPQAGADAGNMQVLIRHAGGQTQVQVDQRVHGGQWNSLGVYEFDPTDGARIRFRSVGSARLVMDSVRLQWVGVDRPKLSLSTKELPVGLKDTEYRASIDASGGTAPYLHEVTGGALPPGLALDSTNGSLSGIAAKPGYYGFEITTTDAAGAKAAQALEVFIGDTAAGGVEPMGMAPAARSDDRQRRLEAASGSSNLNDLLNIVASLPEGGWSKVNLNAFSSVWAPAELRPLFGLSNPNPSKIILAWSSFAWDPNRGALLLYGGGHANYRGNDVYLWRGSTRMWERAALSSEFTKDGMGNVNAIDGVANAPASAHTYDNTLYFPRIDRMLVLGGAADSNGGHFLTQDSPTTSRKTGPYLFNPSRAHPDRVGGSTGSHVKRVAPYPEVVGGNMWANRESWLNANDNSSPPSEAFVNGCTGYAQEAGQDVAYVRTAYRLYKYRIFDVQNAETDRWERVGGFYYGSGGKATCAYDTQRAIFLSTNLNSKPFAFWDLSTPGPTNRESYFAPVDPTGEFAALLSSKAIDIRNCGMDFDPQRADYKIWCGDGRVWTLTPPTLLSSAGWTITKAPAPGTAVPSGNIGTGILGKWKYIPNLDVFMGLQDPRLGDIWVYKPLGWTNPSGSNFPPTVSIMSPTFGASFGQGVSIAIDAIASDRDGAIRRVEFFADGVKLGVATAAPYRTEWATPPAGPHTLTALAFDDRGVSTVSAAVSITVMPTTGGGTTITLQRGTLPGAQTADAYLSSYHKMLNFGSLANLQDQQAYYSSMLRFAIFQSEGGPVPDGAQIHSARLSLFKYSSYNAVYGLHRVLQEWSESDATWNQRLDGVPWSNPGANGADADYAVSADAVASTSFEPGWIHFDITGSVAAMSSGSTRSNFGWRLRSVSGNTNLKRMYASEYTADPTLRPKLVVTYK